MFSFKNLSAKARIAAAVGATLLALGIAGMPTAHASAASPATQITQSQHHATISCTGDRHYKGGSVTFTYCNGSHPRSSCQIGKNGSLSGPLFVANGCSFQVYLWTHGPFSGTPQLCVNPQTSTGVIKQYYIEFEVTGHTGRC